MTDVQKPPKALGARGRTVWRSTVDTYGLSKAELAVLEKWCVLEDEIVALSAQIDADGPMVAGSKGQPVVHPAVAARHVAIALAAKLVGQLKLPDIRGGTLPSPRQVQAQRAAQSRWANHVPRGRRGLAS